MIWTTKSGRNLEIEKMSYDHIRNTIHYLEKRYPNFKRDHGTTDTYQKYEYMKRVLAQRILDEDHRNQIDEINAGRVNPFQYL